MTMMIKETLLLTFLNIYKIENLVNYILTNHGAAIYVIPPKTA